MSDSFPDVLMSGEHPGLQPCGPRDAPGTLSLGPCVGSASIPPKLHGLRGNLDQAHRIPRLTKSPDLTLVWRVLV